MRAILNEADDDDEEEEEEEEEQEEEAVVSRRRGTALTDALDTDDEATEGLGDHDGAQEDTEAQEEDQNDPEEEASLPPDHDLDLSTPEPDFILAEVTTSRTNSKRSGTGISEQEYPIPLPVIHRIMHMNFADPERTTVFTDARALMGKYVEVFVKEAIRRCVDEKKERATNGGVRDGGVGDVGDTGWLEVEDLERVGAQLVLDF